MKKELRERMEETAGNLLDEWGVRHSKYPDYLWHYTSIAGVKGLLTEGCLWFSDAAFLNDSSELSYAVDVAEEIVNQRIEKEEIEPLVREYLQAFVTRIKSDREDRQSFGFIKPAFVACFCKEGDSLHLWRAYTGNGRGYSIGFFPNMIDHLQPLQVEEMIYIEPSVGGSQKVESDTRLYQPALREVIYEEEEQKEILSKVIDSFSEILVNFETEFQLGGIGIKGIFIEKLYYVFYQYLSCFKHPTFKEEKEWRFIYTPYFSTVSHGEAIVKKIEHRESGGYIVPYLKVDIDNVNLPFDVIISGPSLDEKLARASLNSFLLRKGYIGSLIDIVHSSVPLRHI